MCRERRHNLITIGRVLPLVMIGFIFTLLHTHFVDAQVAQSAILLANSNAQRQTSPVQAEPKNLPNRDAKQWVYEEWNVESVSYTGNPFDVVAVVTFEHQASDEVRRTEMFYAGENSWKFRFTATQPGEWTFTSQSDIAALNGLSGSVNVSPNPAGLGFVTHFDEKWGWSGTGEVFVPQLTMYKFPFFFYNKPEMVDADIEEFLTRHGFNGFHVPNIAGGWFNMEGINGKVNTGMTNPDMRTFEALELLITKVYAHGGMVHIWLWGDESRSQASVNLAGGINGPVDRRLQRYIAARLGPLPGWSMGYGFDLWEWVDGPQLTAWHDYMDDHLGWPHLMGARSSKNELNQLSETLDYSGYEQHRPDYNTYVETITERPQKPSFSEDRFRIGNNHPYKDYDMQMIRRGLYHSTMAGGVANIWGNLVGSTHERGSSPYPNPEWIKTYSTFFADRFSRDVQRCPDLTDGLCLRRPTNRHYVFYQENSDAIRMDLSGMDGSQPGVAVDAKKAYAEISLGSLDAKDQTWTAPYASDWVIAVGDYGATSEPDPDPDPDPEEPPVTTPQCPCLYLPYLLQ